MVQKGFNTDLQLGDKRYHIQTEDWGTQNPFIVTRIFCNGAVHKTIKTPYSDFVKSSPVRMEEAVSLALRRQHHQAIDLLQTQRNLSL